LRTAHKNHVILSDRREVKAFPFVKGARFPILQGLADTKNEILRVSSRHPDDKLVWLTHLAGCPAEFNKESGVPKLCFGTPDDCT
jgi:hypothetical protein